MPLKMYLLKQIKLNLASQLNHIRNKLLKFMLQNAWKFYKNFQKSYQIVYFLSVKLTNFNQSIKNPNNESYFF